MMAYLVLLIFVSLGSYIIYKPQDEKSRIKVAIFATIAVTVFLGSIDAREFGTDVMNYYNNADVSLSISLKQYMSNSKFESGFCVYLWAITRLVGSAQGFLYVTYLFINTVYIGFLCKYSYNPVSSLFFYLSIGTLAFYQYAIRQGMALAICLIALIFAMKKKKIFSLLLVAFAMLFHSTAIVFAPLIIVAGVKLNKQRIMLISVITIVFIAGLDRLIAIGEQITDKEYGVGFGESLSKIGGIINLTIFAFFIVLYVICKKKETKDNFYYLSLFIAIVAMAIYATRFYTLALERVSFYFTPIYPVLFSHVMSKQKVFGPRKIFNLIVMGLCVALFMWRNLGTTVPFIL